jgi:hypothetical protein
MTEQQQKRAREFLRQIVATAWNFDDEETCIPSDLYMQIAELSNELEGLDVARALNDFPAASLP